MSLSRDRWGQPVGKCGRVTWYCPHEPNDPACCQFDPEKIEARRREHERWLMEERYGHLLDAEYGPRTAR